MFKEIETELLSIISDDPIERIAHMPTNEIAKTMDLIYGIKYEDIKRVYIDKVSTINNMTIIYDAKDKKHIGQDVCPINGKVYHITFFPEFLLNKDENNAITLSKAIITYISSRISVISDGYENIMDKVSGNTLYKTTIQSIPIITCAIMRKIYSGPSLPKVIYMSLTELVSTYKSLYTEEGVETILNLMDEGLGVSELLDSAFICSIEPDNEKYPGIWEFGWDGESDEGELVSEDE